MSTRHTNLPSLVFSLIGSRTKLNFLAFPLNACYRSVLLAITLQHLLCRSTGMPVGSIWRPRTPLAWHPYPLCPQPSLALHPGHALMSRKNEGSVSRGQGENIGHLFCGTFTSSDLPPGAWTLGGEDIVLGHTDSSSSWLLGRSIPSASPTN